MNQDDERPPMNVILFFRGLDGGEGAARLLVMTKAIPYMPP